MTPTCNRCGQPIRWAFHRNCWIPMATQPHPEGRYRPTGRRRYERFGGVALERAQEAGWHLYRPHIEECAPTNHEPRPARRATEGNHP